MGESWLGYCLFVCLFLIAFMEIICEKTIHYDRDSLNIWIKHIAENKNHSTSVFILSSGTCPTLKYSVSIMQQIIKIWLNGKENVLRVVWNFPEWAEMDFFIFWHVKVSVYNANVNNVSLTVRKFSLKYSNNRHTNHCRTLGLWITKHLE